MNTDTAQARVSGTLNGLVKQCPFCGATAYDFDPEAGLHAIQSNVCASKEDGSDVYYLSCNVCGASGPLCDSIEMAQEHFFKPNATLTGQQKPGKESAS